MVLTITQLAIIVALSNLYIFKLLEYTSLKKWFMDSPEEDRKIHKEMIPRYGGTVFAGLSLVALSIVPFFEPIRWVVVGAWSLYALGVFDDMYQLSWKVKAPVQLVLSCWILMTQVVPMESIYLFGVLLPDNHFLIGLLFTVWFLGITNAINLIDGMDGLAGGVSSLMLIGITLLGVSIGSLYMSSLTIVVLSGLIIFLIHNSKPARLFMGDTGSLFLGYIFAILPIVSVSNSLKSLDLAPYLIIYAYIIVDTLRVMLVRLKNKKNPLSPGNEHFHHLLFLNTKSYNGTVFLIFLTVASCIILSLKLNYSYAISVMFVALSLVMIISKFFQSKVVTLCTFIVALLRGLFSRGLTINLKTFKGLIWVFCINLMYLFVVISKWEAGVINNGLIVAMALVIGYLILFRVDHRNRLIINILVLSIATKVLISGYSVNGYIIGFNSIVIILLGLSEFKKLLLRYWTIFDMLVLFVTLIISIQSDSFEIQLMCMYLITLYIVTQSTLRRHLYKGTKL